jgi:hypothetical protein
MQSFSPRLILGAAMFTTPGMRSGGVHVVLPILVTVVVGVISVSIALALVQRSWKPGPPGPDHGDGWWRPPEDPPPDPPRAPRGGIPLDDAVPARVRLRGAARLADVLPRRVRRPAREPERRPVRERTPS